MSRRREHPSCNPGHTWGPGSVTLIAHQQPRLARCCHASQGCNRCRQARRTWPLAPPRLTRRCDAGGAANGGRFTSCSGLVSCLSGLRNICTFPTALPARWTAPALSRGARPVVVPIRPTPASGKGRTLREQHHRPRRRPFGLVRGHCRRHVRRHHSTRLRALAPSCWRAHRARGHGVTRAAGVGRPTRDQRHRPHAKESVDRDHPAASERRGRCPSGGGPGAGRRGANCASTGQFFAVSLAAGGRSSAGRVRAISAVRAITAVGTGPREQAGWRCDATDGGRGFGAHGLCTRRVCARRLCPRGICVDGVCVDGVCVDGICAETVCAGRLRAYRLFGH